MQIVVDLDDVLTWPLAVRGFAEHWAAALDGTTCYPSDLSMPPAARESFMTLIGDQPVRAYHCTRLLDEEAAAVRQHGLAPLSDELVMARIRRACTAGWLTTAEGDALLSGSAISAQDSEGLRLGQICAVSGRAIFDDDPGAVEPLLSLWGGETIYWAHERTVLGDRLRALGKPSVVVTGLRLAVGLRPPFFAPDLPGLFVARLLQLPETYGDVHYYGPVGAEDIAGIWQPGQCEYDRHPLLPRS